MTVSILKRRTSIVESRAKERLRGLGYRSSGFRKIDSCDVVESPTCRTGGSTSPCSNPMSCGIFTPRPRYDEEEREAFYRQMVYIGALLTQHGVPVIFDATANRRRYRDQARQQIPTVYGGVRQLPSGNLHRPGPEGNLSQGPRGRSGYSCALDFSPPTNHPSSRNLSWTAVESAGNRRPTRDENFGGEGLLRRQPALTVRDESPAGWLTILWIR